MTIHTGVPYKSKRTFDLSTVTVTGDVLIENGVASNFSDSAYVKANVGEFTITPTDSFEIRVDFTHEEIDSQNNFFTVGSGVDGSYYNGMALTNTPYKEVYVKYYHTREGSDGKFLTSAGVENLVVGKRYYLILTYNGNKRYMSNLYDADTNKHLYTGGKNLADNATPFDINSEGKVVFGYGLYDNRSFGSVYPFPGKIDLNNCYIKVNGEYVWKSFTEELVPATKDDYDATLAHKIKDVCKAWHEDKNNVHIINHPTVVNNTVTNFDNDNYAKTSVPIAIGASDYEVVAAFELRSVPENFYEIISLNFGLALSATKDLFVHHNVGNGTEWSPGLTGTSKLSLNKKYWVKAVRSAGTVTLFYSVDGERWIQQGSMQNSYSVPTNYFGIGIKINGDKEFSKDTIIYLKDCYIKINEDFLWKGTTPYAPNFSFAGNGTQLNGTDLYDFTNGWCVLPETMEFSKGNWVKYLDITTGDVIPNQEVWGSTTTSGTSMNFIDGKIRIYGTNVTNDWNVFLGIESTLTLKPNTRYQIKYFRSGKAYQVDVKGGEYVDWTNFIYIERDAEVSNQQCTLGKFPNSSIPFRGVYHLENCYISILVNGEYKYWYAVVKNYIKTRFKQIYHAGTKYYKWGDINATIVGSPTFNKYIVSGFNGNNYLKLPQTFNPGNSSWEVTAKVKGNFVVLGNEVSGWPSLLWFDGGYIRLYRGDRAQRVISLVSDTTYPLDQWIWVRFSFDGNNKYTISHSYDGENFTVEKSTTSSVKMEALLDIGAFYDQGGGGWGSSNGSIDLKESYIKINGNYWWRGAKVAETTEADAEWSEVHPRLVYQALDDWEIPYRLEGCSWSSSQWNNNNDIPLMFDKNWDTRCGSGGGNGNSNVRTISITLPYEVYVERGQMVNGVADRNGVGLTNNFQIWTNSGKGTPLTNYESINRSNKAVKDFNSINPKVKTNTLYFEIWGDRWTGCTEIYLYGKRFL